MKDQDPEQETRAKRPNPWVMAKSTIELIAKYGCMPSPKAYEVFFAYAGDNALVCEQVDRAAQADGLLTSFDLDRIHHDNFRTNDGEWERQQRASLDIEASIRQAVAGIDDHAKAGEDYERRLVEASGRIGQTTSPEDLSRLLKSLVEDTDAARAASEAMRDNLSRTSKTVSDVTAEVSASRSEAAKDLLTELMSRRGFDVTIQAAVDEAVRNGTQVMLCVFAVDDFDAINAVHGRGAGDAVIRSIGRMVRRFSTGNDVAARIGGVSFALLMKGCSLREAVTTADAMRTELGKRRFAPPGAEDGIGPLTASFGMSVMTAGDRAGDLVDRAGENVAMARARGGDRVVCDTVSSL